MTKIGKITVSLTFDDILDEYKFRISKFIAKLPVNEDYRTVFYYLMGIFESLESAHIYRYFWSKLTQNMNL